MKREGNMMKDFNDLREIVPLYYDRAFKLIFNTSKGILIKFLREVLNIEINDNANILIGEEALGKYVDSKNFRHDMVIEIDNTNYICLELNANSYVYSINRNFIYLIDLLLSRLSKGLTIEELDKYKVRLLNLNMFSNICGEVIDEAALIYLKSRLEASKMFKIIDFDIAKCYEMMYNDKKKKDNLIRWGSIFNAKTVSELSYLLGDDLLTMEEKREFLDNVRAANRDEELVAAWRSERNEKWKQQSYENGLKKEREEGREEGLEEGRVQGRQSGLTEGRKETTINIIKNMLNKKYDYNSISDITGKTIKEIKEIESNI